MTSTPRISLRLNVGFAPLSSRAEHERPKDGHAESRDPRAPNTLQRPDREFSIQISGEVHGKDSSLSRVAARGHKGSFDCAKGFAIESLHSAQDARCEGL